MVNLSKLASSFIIFTNFSTFYTPFPFSDSKTTFYFNTESSYLGLSELTKEWARFFLNWMRGSGECGSARNSVRALFSPVLRFISCCWAASGYPVAIFFIVLLISDSNSLFIKQPLSSIFPISCLLRIKSFISLIFLFLGAFCGCFLARRAYEVKLCEMESRICFVWGSCLTISWSAF